MGLLGGQRNDGYSMQRFSPRHANIDAVTANRPAAIMLSWLSAVLSSRDEVPSLRQAAEHGRVFQPG
jgi:hypothetical protein